MGEREGYVLLIKQLTSPQIILPSGKFNCVRKRCNYRPITFEFESANDMCNPTCTKNGPNVQPNKSRFKRMHRTWAYAMGIIWEPWQSQLSLLQKKIWVRAPESYWYILRDQASFQSSATPPLSCFYPKAFPEESKSNPEPSLRAWVRQTSTTEAPDASATCGKRRQRNQCPF